MMAGRTRNSRKKYMIDRILTRVDFCLINSACSTSLRGIFDFISRKRSNSLINGNIVPWAVFLHSWTEPRSHVGRQKIYAKPWRRHRYRTSKVVIHLCILYSFNRKVQRLHIPLALRLCEEQALRKIIIIPSLSVPPELGTSSRGNP